jgi:hypothetical protein
VRDPLEVGGGGGVDGGSPRAVDGGTARRGEVGDGGRDRWSPGVPEWLVTGYAIERSSWGSSGAVRGWRRSRWLGRRGFGGGGAGRRSMAPA